MGGGIIIYLHIIYVNIYFLKTENGTNPYQGWCYRHSDGRNLNGAIGYFYAAYGEAVGTAKAVERNAHSALLRELG